MSVDGVEFEVARPKKLYQAAAIIRMRRNGGKPQLKRQWLTEADRTDIMEVYNRLVTEESRGLLAEAS